MAMIKYVQGTELALQEEEKEELGKSGAGKPVVLYITVNMGWVGAPYQSIIISSFYFPSPSFHLFLPLSVLLSSSFFLSHSYNYRMVKCAQ